VNVEACQRCGRSHPPGPCPDEAGGGTRSLLPSLDLLPGAQVGEYRVTGPLGRGGMGIVYAGVHPILGRKVAIKILSHHMAQRDEASARFLQEARAASALRHPNIVDVFAFGQLPDGRYYQVMELLEGESLRSLLDRTGAVPPAWARTIIGGVLAGLSAAHRKGVVHRDIKPDNIFICTPIGDADLSPADVKILDFGVAKHDTGGGMSIKTRTGTTLGTPAYMSPEQCRGMATVDARTDIYAAGVLLFEMLAGRTPFQSESAFDVMAMQIHARLPSLAKVTGRAETLEPVIVKALEKRPEERFETASEMLAAIASAALPELAPSVFSTPPSSSPALPRDFADRETLLASDAATEVEPAVQTASYPAGAVSTFTGGAWRRRGVPQLAVGAALGLVAIGIFLAATRARRPAPAPTTSIPPPPVVAAPAPALPAVLVPPPPEAPTRPAASAHARAHGTAPARAREGKATAKAPRAAHGDARVKEVDLDAPWNPYAR
jgi:serine/threonine-protein kinase